MVSEGRVCQLVNWCSERVRFFRVVATPAQLTHETDALKRTPAVNAHLGTILVADAPHAASGMCDKCDGPHLTSLCPWFNKRKRFGHADAVPLLKEERPLLAPDELPIVIRGIVSRNHPTAAACTTRFTTVANTGFNPPKPASSCTLQYIERPNHCHFTPHVTLCTLR